MADFGQTDFGQTDFGQFQCFNVPGGFGAAGFHTTARELQTCTLEGPGLQKHHQNSTRRHPERHKKSEMVAGEGKKARNFGRSGGGEVRRRVVWRRVVQGNLNQQQPQQP